MQVEQQAALPNPGPRLGLGGVQQQQPPARVSAPSSVSDAANSGTGFRSAGSGLGQTLGPGMDSGAGVDYGQQGQQQNTFGRRPMAAYQPASVYGSRGPIVKNEATARIIPITALNPCEGRWTIKVRITAKSDVRRFRTAKGEAKVFSFDLLDADGGEIRATCFNKVVGQFYDRVEVGKVYLISKGSLKAAKKAYNHLKNDWEIVLESQTTIEVCSDEDSSILRPHFHFQPISDVETLENNALIDVIGVVVSVNPTQTTGILRKNGIDTQERILQMKDWSGRSVELAMRGAYCNKEGQELQALCDSGAYPVLAVKSAQVIDFHGKSLSTISSTQLVIHPDHPEAHRVREWFDRGGKNSAAFSRAGGGGGRLDQRQTVKGRHGGQGGSGFGGGGGYGGRKSGVGPYGGAYFGGYGGHFGYGGGCDGGL